MPVNQQISYTSFYYKNKKMGSKKLVFEFASSNEELLFPTNDTLVFFGGETKQIELQVAARSNVGTEEVYLYVSDTEQHFMECIAFEIIYVHV